MYTPELVAGLGRDEEILEVSSLVLHDIDRERVDVVGGMAKRMLEKARLPRRVRGHRQLDRALEGTDFVLIQIRVVDSGLEQRQVDHGPGDDPA